MTREQSCFLTILSDHLHGRPTPFRENIQWEELFRIANAHQLSGILYYQCREQLPSDESTRPLRRRYSTEAFYYANRSSLFGKVSRELSAAGIPFFTVKGLDVAELYPVPALRTMGDCDIVVHPEDRQRACEVFTGLGFSGKPVNFNEWVFRRSNMDFELHDHLMYEEDFNAPEDLVFGERAWEHCTPVAGETRFSLDWDYHTAFLLLHMKKHLLYRGIGFRQFMDLAVVAQRCPLRWEVLGAYLDELHLRDFAGVCFSLIERWFGAATPFSNMALPEDFIVSSTEKVFANGIFGFHDTENGNNPDLVRVGKKHCPRWWIKVTELLRVLFPGYRNMYYVPAYSFLRGRPWLLPAAWVYRFAFVLLRKRQAVGEELRFSLTADRKADALREELSRWGLQPR